MCSGPGFSLINVGDEEHILAKEYTCLDCGSTFKGLGVIPSCPGCKSKNVKRVKKHSV
ncbi:MAG: zinc ribbon domain-containing protein [Methanothrix sp.]|nr:zinc ribbon domain-containing protein [Methanothrix sp.]